MQKDFIFDHLHLNGTYEIGDLIVHYADNQNMPSSSSSISAFGDLFTKLGSPSLGILLSIGLAFIGTYCGYRFMKDNQAIKNNSHERDQAWSANQQDINNNWTKMAQRLATINRRDDPLHDSRKWYGRIAIGSFILSAFVAGCNIRTYFWK